MNLYHLRYFVTLARLEHYTNAAEELMITQPSLSYAINALELELGVQLFEKMGRNISLTKYGKLFLSSAETSLRILDSSINNLKMVGAGEGTIELAFLRVLGVDLVPRIIRGFLNENQGKNINFNLSTGNGLTVDLLDGLKTKKHDIVMCSKLDNEPLINFTPIATQELGVIVPLDHPLAKKESLDLKETLDYPHIMFRYKSGLRHIIDDIFSEIGAYPKIAYEVEEDQVVAGLVAYGFGIAITPKMYILDSLDVKLIDISYPRWERNFYLATLKKSYYPPVVELFIDYVINYANLNKMSSSFSKNSKTL